MSMDWMIWAIMLQQQAQEAAARRAAEEAKAKAKADADAQAAAQAQTQRQAQIASQRQSDAITAQKAEDERLASLRSRQAPIAPADAWSPVGGSFYGSKTPQSSARPVAGMDQQTASMSPNNGFMKPATPPPRGAPPSNLGAMMGAATQPQQQQQRNMPNMPQQKPSGSYSMF